MSRKRLAIFISGRGSNMDSLLNACQAVDYPAVPVLVLSNKPNAGGLDKAAARGVPTAVVDHRAYANREAFEKDVQEALIAANVEFIALAGFMRVLTPWFISRWEGRLINIHPSLLPSFPGLQTHRRAIEAGCRLAGCTVHHVTAGVDEGPIIGQAAVPVRPDDNDDSLAARVLTAEHMLYPVCLAAAIRNNPARSAHVRMGGSADSPILLSTP